MTMTVNKQYPAASPTRRPENTIKKTATAVAKNHHIIGAGTDDSTGAGGAEVRKGDVVVIALEKSDFVLLKLGAI